MLYRFEKGGGPFTGSPLLFFLFLLSKEARNITIKPLRDISKANIPMQIVMISYAVMGVPGAIRV